MEFIKLNNGIEMPLLGLGTYTLTGKDGQRAMSDAIEIGYRLFDSAQMYCNEAELGDAVRESGIKRKELFIETKLLDCANESKTKKAIESSLKALKVDYIDLLLLHNNYPNAKAMYRVMEDFYKQGILKAIGISNFGMSAYSDFIQSVEVIPAINQCETHLLFQQVKLQKLMQKYGTILQSWSPFVGGRDNIFENKTLQNITKKYSKTPAQTILRYLIQKGIIVIPKTSKISHLKENISVFDFSLNIEDIAALLALNTNKSRFSWTNY